MMTPAEREKITDLTKCDFREMHEHYVKLREERRALSKEEKQKLKEVWFYQRNDFFIVGEMIFSQKDHITNFYF